MAATRSGLTARAMSRFRPSAQLVGVSPVERTVRQLTLSWGVVPLLVDQCDTLDDLVWYSVSAVVDAGLVGRGRARGDAGRLAHLERRRDRRAADRADQVSHGLHVEESGPPGAALVVLVHGTMDRSTGFARVARRLDDRYRVLRYDRRGYARSRGLPGPHGCEAHVDDLLNLLDGRHATLVGHSYGGNVALAASVRAPESVNAVGMYETPLPWQSWWPGTTAARRRRGG